MLQLGGLAAAPTDLQIGLDQLIQHNGPQRIVRRGEKLSQVYRRFALAALLKPGDELLQSLPILDIETSQLWAGRHTAFFLRSAYFEHMEAPDLSQESRHAWREMVLSTYS